MYVLFNGEYLSIFVICSKAEIIEMFAIWPPTNIINYTGTIFHMVHAYLDNQLTQYIVLHEFNPYTSPINGPYRFIIAKIMKIHTISESKQKAVKNWTVTSLFI